ncbi:ferredoxin [Mycobacterium sp. pUA109]
MIDEIPSHQREAATQAVASCPSQALRVTD